MSKYIKIFALLFVTFFAFDIFSQGCSQCKMLSEQASELDEASFGTNINFGIMYLISPILWFLPPLIYRGITPDANPEQAYILAAKSVLPFGVFYECYSGVGI